MMTVRLSALQSIQVARAVDDLKERAFQMRTHSRMTHVREVAI
jgi:hypothetical protein